MKIYVGCSLTFATQEFRDSIEKLKEELHKDHDVLRFLGFRAGTPEEIFQHDTKLVKSCDLLLAEVSYPSTGLGYEIGIALCLEKPIIAVAKADAEVSTLLLGAHALHPNFCFHRYKDTSEITQFVEKKIKETFS